MRKSWKLGGIAAVVLLVGGAGVAVMASKGDGPKKPGDDKPKTVLEVVPSEVVKPTLTAMPDQIEFSGQLVAPRTASGRAEFKGMVLSRALGEGSRVVAGQALGQVY